MTFLHCFLRDLGMGSLHLTVSKEKRRKPRMNHEQMPTFQGRAEETTSQELKKPPVEIRWKKYQESRDSEARGGESFKEEDVIGRVILGWRARKSETEERMPVASQRAWCRVSGGDVTQEPFLSLLLSSSFLSEQFSPKFLNNLVLGRGAALSKIGAGGWGT